LHRQAFFLCEPDLWFSLVRQSHAFCSMQEARHGS
jgi:hypothetical protein